MHPLRRLGTTLCLVSLLALMGCTSIYYDAMEQIGKHKRDILRDRVVAAKDDQRAAEEQFQSAYESFKAVSGYDGGNLESAYDELNGEYEAREARAEAVSDRISSIETVAADLFEEWESEIDMISNASLRSSSSRKLAETKNHYGQLIRAMKRAESKMEPVLVAFRDQVLYLKHNLNAQAIAALEGSVQSIEGDVESLIDEIRVSIREAESFLQSMGETA
jgi:hypothetical protein